MPMVIVGVPMQAVEQGTVDELDLEADARLTPTNAAPAAAAAMAARMIHFLWLPDPILVVVGVISPDFAATRGVGCAAVSGAATGAG